MVQLTISFPVFVVCNCDHTPAVASLEKQDFVLAFSTQELAELYIEQAGNSNVNTLVGFRTPGAFVKSLRAIQTPESKLRDVNLLAWNCTVNASQLCIVEINSLIAQLESSMASDSGI